MARRKSPTSLRPIGEINLTPLMDLTFILLITFIITFPLIEEGIIVDLPKADADDIKKGSAETITLDHKGNVYLNEARMTMQDLEGTLKGMAAGNSDISVMIRADEHLEYGNVVRVLKLLHETGISRMALVTQSEN